jgi:hypothetical protein
MANTSGYIRRDRIWERKWDMLSSKKKTRSGKESYIKTRCSVRSSLQLLEHYNKIIIIIDSLSTIMTAENHTQTKNPKTQTIRMMLDHEGPRITLLKVPSHVGIPGNEKANQAAKEVLAEDISTTEIYPPDDLKKWLTEEDFKKRGQRWKNRNNEMKERKPDVNKKEDTRGMPGKEQVAISRLRTGYTRATHDPKIGNPLCPFCNTHLSVYHILWECNETEDQRTNMDMKKVQWINGKSYGKDN